MSLNNTTDCRLLSAEEALDYGYTLTETLIIVAVLPAISVIGILLNSAFLFTLYRVKDMKTDTNIYLANLAIVDGLVLIIVPAEILKDYLYSPVIQLDVTFFERHHLCGILFLLVPFFTFTSSFFISLVALERYTAICRPAIHRQSNSKSRTFKLSLMSWIASFVIVACHNGSFSNDDVCMVLPSAPNVAISLKTCQPSDLAYLSIIMIDVCLFLLAFVGNCTLYICIVRRLNKRKGRNTSRERNHVARMLAINACVFFICLSPMTIAELIYLGMEYFGLEVDVGLLNWIALTTVAVNSAINPVIYNVFNPDYRKAFRRAFTCIK